MHNRKNLVVILSALVVLAAGVALIVWGAPQLANLFSTERPAGQVGYDTSTVRAEVVEILEAGQITLGDHRQRYQVFNARVLEGDYTGQIIEIEYGLQQVRAAEADVRLGDQVLISIGQRPDGSLVAFFTDFIRSGSLLQLFLVFVALSVLISGWKGVRGLLGIGFSLLVITFFIIPQILAGKNPVLISILGSFMFLSVSLYLVYGWTLKTHAAVVGMLIALVLTGSLSWFFINFTRLNGFGDENAMFLVQMTNTPLDLRGLLLGGMIIGALGVLDDLVISQSSAVFELHGANPNLTLSFLYRRAMNIGRDHVAATVNTLVLAYTGASLPMLLMFSISNQNIALLLNINFIAEEVVRTLVGSMGLFASVPITTGLACLAAVHADRLGKIRRFLGPETSGDGHTHSH
ncbi:MAG: YibE/F family protein [Chloroflexota bacterium]